MRTLEFADAAILQIAMRQDIDRSEESPYDYRLHGVWLVAGGRSCTAVSQVFGADATTASARDGPSRWTRGSGRVWRVTCVAIRAAVVMPITSGTVRRWPSV
jgi:hypothetical protein